MRVAKRIRDGWFNACHILKLAGLGSTQRTYTLARLRRALHKKHDFEVVVGRSEPCEQFFWGAFEFASLSKLQYFIV